MVHTKKKYNSNDGMSTDIWGPAIWHFLHTISFNYPTNPTEKDKKNYASFVNNLQNILPCADCRYNLEKKYKRSPLSEKDLKSRGNFSRYIYNLHESVNKMLKKKTSISYKNLRDKYEGYRADSHSHSHSYSPNNRTRKHKEKQKCVLRIIPKSIKCKTFK